MPAARAVSLRSQQGRCAGNESSPQPFRKPRNSGAEHAQSLRTGTGQFRPGAPSRSLPLVGSFMPAALDRGVFSLRRADRAALQCRCALVSLSESQRRSCPRGSGSAGTYQRCLLRPLFRHRRSCVSGGAYRKPHGGAAVRILYIGGICLYRPLLRKFPGIAGCVGNRATFCSLHRCQRYSEGFAGSRLSALPDRTAAGWRCVPLRGRSRKNSVSRTDPLSVGSRCTAPAL